MQTQKRKAAPLLAAAMLCALALSGCGSKETATFAGGSGTKEDPWQIATVEQLGKVRDDLTKSYILTADLDLGSEAFTPIGTFEPKSDAEEDAETPKDSAAFTGHFDGDGHKLSNIVINGENAGAAGLFGCVTGDGSGVEDLAVENLKVSGGSYTGGVIGYGDYGATVKGIKLTGKNEVSGTFLVGGIVGAAHCDISDCEAAANIVLTEAGKQGAGIIVGGEEDGNVENCTASGSVKAGDGCYSIGGLAGCFQNSAYAKNCTAKDITITAGENASLVGGLTGHAGTTEGSPTAITGCKVENVSIQAGGTAQRIGGVIGGGFYMAQFAQYYAEPLPFQVSGCTVSGVKLTGGKLVGSIAGYIYSNSTADGSVADVTWNGAALEAKAGADASTPVSELS